MSWVPGYTDTTGYNPSLDPFGDPFFNPPYGPPAPISPGYPPEGAPPNTPFPGSPPSSPPPPFVGPPVATPEPPVTQPPPIGFDPTPAPGIDTGWIAGIGGGFFNPRRYTRPSQAELLLRRGIRDLGKAAVDAWQRLQTGPKLRFAPGGPKPPGGLPTVYNAPVPPTPRVMVTPISIIVGVVTGLIPRNIFQAGELPFTEAEKFETRSNIIRSMAGELRMIGLPAGNAPPTYTDPRRVPDMLLEPLPQAKPALDYSLERFLLDRAAGRVLDLGYDWLRSQIPGLPAPSATGRQQREVGPPEPRVNIGDIRSSAPTPAPPATTTPGQVITQQTIPSSRSSTGRSSRTRRNRIFGFGTLGTLILLTEASRRNSRDPTARAPTITPEPLTPTTPDPGTPPIPVPQPGGSTAGYYAAGGGSTAYCTPRPRGPRRKCLERAPVRYSGGRRKGAAAGTKCLRWEAPKR